LLNIAKDDEYHLTVIIPVFNGEHTINSCIKSILQQQTTYKIEIIIIDDGSTDKTYDNISEFSKLNSNITLISNKINSGKANAVSKGYSIARGKYIQILDADDLLVGKEKFQKQICLLEQNINYGAVAHNTLILYPENRINLISNEFYEKQYSYEQIMRFQLYFHTSSIMYRKLTISLPEDFAEHESLRGDSAFLYFHIFNLKTSIFYSPDVHSIYNFHGNGLWSKMSKKEQLLLTENLFQHLCTYVVKNKNQVEYFWLQEKIKEIKNQLINPLEIYQPKEIESILGELVKYSGKVYETNLFHKISNSIQTISFIDSLAEAIGTALAHKKHSPINYNRKNYNRDTVAILISGFDQKGGGIFNETINLVNLHLQSGKTVFIVSTNMVDKKIYESPEVFQDPNVFIYEAVAEDFTGRINSIIEYLYSIKPSELYCFLSHHDLVGSSILIADIAEKIFFNFVYDHVSTIALTNSSIDVVITKNSQQAEAIAGAIPLKTIVVLPPFTLVRNKYSNPLSFDGELKNTASGSARAYKYEKNSKINFPDVIVEVLRNSTGIHYHYGPLSKTLIIDIFSAIALEGIDYKRFVNLPFSLDFSSDLINRSVEAFIAPISRSSTLLKLEVMSTGIPIFLFNTDDFIHTSEDQQHISQGQFSYSSLKQLSMILKNLEIELYTQASDGARSFYAENHSFEAAIQRYKNLERHEYRGQILGVPRDLIKDAFLSSNDLLTIFQPLPLKLVDDFETVCTIIVLMRNHENFVSDCFTSVAREFPNAKILSVDVNSSDNSFKKVQLICSELNLDSEHIHISVDMSTLKVLKFIEKFVLTDFIILLSGDDALGEDYGNTLKNLFRTNPEYQVINFASLVTDKFLNPLNVKYSRWNAKTKKNRRLLSYSNPGTAPGAVIPWKILVKNPDWKQPPNILIEDYWLWWQLIDQVPFINCKKSHVLYRQHESNLSKQTKRKDYAYSLGYVSALPNINASNILNTLLSIVLIPRWIRHLNVSVWKDYAKGYVSAIRNEVD
jgi:glycosyltransferase involved in cell wall biosynthesis